MVILGHPTVHCHSWLSGNKDCHEFRFSIVRIVINVSIVTSLQDCLVSQIYLYKCISQNVFVKLYLSKCICQNVFFSCLSISLIKCLKGQKCQGLVFNVKNQKWLRHSVTQSVSQWVSQWQGHLLSCLWTAKNLHSCPLYRLQQISTQLVKFSLVNQTRASGAQVFFFALTLRPGGIGPNSRTCTLVYPIHLSLT